MITDTVALHRPEPMSRSTAGRRNLLKVPPDIIRNPAHYGSNHVHCSPQEVRVVTDKLTEGAKNNQMELVGRTTTDEAFEIRCKIEVPTAPDPTPNESWRPVRPTENSRAPVLEPGTFFASRPTEAG